MIKYFSKEIEENVERIANKYINADGVESLYHFTSVSAIHSIIENQSLRLTESTFMNDRTEYIDAHKMVSETANEMASQSLYEEYKHILIEMSKEHLEETESHKTYLEDGWFSVFYILSTCTNYESVPMWNYYSDKTGVCIEFDKEELNKMLESKVKLCNKRNSYKSNHISHYKCLYDIKEKKQLLEEIISACLPSIQEEYSEERKNKRSGLYVDFANLVRDYAYVFKNEIFKYEKEHRSIIEFQRDDNCCEDEYDKSRNIIRHFYSTDQTIRPCITIKFEDKLPIKAIYISPTSQNETVTRGLKLLLEHYGYDNVTVNRLDMSIRNNY